MTAIATSPPQRPARRSPVSRLPVRWWAVPATALAAVGLSGCLGSQQYNAPTAAQTAFNLRGSVAGPSAPGATSDGLCTTTSSGVAKGGKVEIKDGTGATLATSTLTQGFLKAGPGSPCVLQFSADNVPRGKDSYVISVVGGPTVTRTSQQLRETDDRADVVVP